MSRYREAAHQAIVRALDGRQDPVPLFTVSCWADTAARAAGKKRDLFESLYPYAELLPATHTTRWLTAAGGSGDAMLMVVRRDWKPGSTPSSELLLGAGSLVEADHVD